MPLKSRRFSGNARLQSASENNPPLRKGAKGEAVALVQQTLIELGFDMPISTAQGTAPPDGIYGDETVTTVYKFQAQQGFQKDGIAGHDTLHRLDDLVAAKEPDENRPPDLRNWSASTHRGW
jgi:peptidoglycan hydrolase-like protein with peptidoglycan-binding domain